MGKNGYTKKLERKQADAAQLKASAPPKQPSALERLAQLEGGLKNVVIGVNRALKEIDGRQSFLREALDAVVGLVGKDAVEQAIMKARKENTEAAVADEEEALAAAIEDGTLEKIEKVEEGCIVISTEHDKDGNLTASGYEFPNGRHHRYLAGYKKEVQEAIMGQGIGHKIDLKTGGTLLVEAIYKMIQPKEDEEPESPEAQAEVAAIEEALQNPAPAQA